MATDPFAASPSLIRDDQRDGATSWIHLDRPDPTTVQSIGARLGVHPDHVAACAAASASPRVDDQGRYLFVTLHLPVLGPESPSGTVTTLSAIVTSHDLLTVQIGPGAAVARLHRECQDDASRRRELFSGGAPALLSRLVAAWVASASSQLDALRDESREIADLVLGRREDGSLEAARDPEAVAAIARIRHSVAHARRVLEAQWPLLDAIAARPARAEDGDPARILWRSAASQMAALAARAAAVCDDADGLLLAVSALNAQQTSIHTRLVVLLGGALLPILLVLGIFATNVRDLPFVGEPRGFETILAIAVVAGLLSLYLLRRRL